MVKFAHISDVHLGGWKQPPLQELGLRTFAIAIETCIKEKVEFVIIAGDLFDNPYPPIDILKESFSEFKKLKEAGIPCFLIAGSHDSSASGKTFLDVLEKAGFCKNVFDCEEREGVLFLNPTIYKNVAFYGYPGKRSGLEVDDLKRVKLQDAPGLFKIFLLHTTLDKVKGDLPIDSVSTETLPHADYYALGHIHVDFQYENFVYPGPLYPNSFQELEDINHGSFYIVETNPKVTLKKIEIRLKETIKIEAKVNDASTGTDKIIAELEKKDLEDKIILLRVSGIIENGKHSDIKFPQIEEYTKQKKAFFLLKNTHDLRTKEVEIELKNKDSENIESEAVEQYTKENPSSFNNMISDLMNALNVEKQEDEKTIVFENRVLEGAKKLLNF